MNYQSELLFLINILENMHLPVSILEEPYENAHIHDFGIRKILYPDINYAKYIQAFCTSCRSHVLYKANDEYLFQYLILKLPKEIPSCLLIGPYTLTPWDENVLYNLAQDFHIAPENYSAFRECYTHVPLITDTAFLYTLVNTFCTKIWGSIDSFIMEELSNVNPFEEKQNEFTYDSSSLFSSMNYVEKKFQAEAQMMQIVSHGQLHKLEMYSNLISLQDTEIRLGDKVRNAKNYAIIMNTLLRKAAENGAVHPIHINHISSEFAKKIELQTSEASVISLIRDMARKYTLLVKNHSLQGYSNLVRKALIHIDMDLSADLTLSTIATLLDVNPSYLSTVFKKETGQTLTEYVTGKRIDHAIFLLNSTNMQIQTIAQYCGIPDVCYFTKIFKKIIGKSPTEYKNHIMH